MIYRIFLSFAFMLFLSACENGADNSGPYKAYLLLKSPNQKIVRFYLGDYNKLDHCVQQVKYEVDNAFAGKLFWTNSEYSYGGGKQEGWIENKIVGVICETDDRYKGWKVLSVED